MDRLKLGYAEILSVRYTIPALSLDITLGLVKQLRHTNAINKCRVRTFNCCMHFKNSFLMPRVTSYHKYDAEDGTDFQE